jgi:hypothetical protein
VRRHTEEAVACVFVESMGMRSTCAECRSLCVQSRGHFSVGGRDGDVSLSESFTVDVRVWGVVSEVLRANQDSSFLECFLQSSQLLLCLKLADAKHALTKSSDQASLRATCCKWHSTAFHNRRDNDNRRILLLLHPHTAACTTHHHDCSLNNPTYTSVAFRAHCKRIAFTRHPPQLN